MSNRLQYEISPYLLQHKDNPVDWYPWCDEAFARAAAEDKPVFLSIGYSTCHWCHVQDRESFEDAEIAGLLNRFFIAVKVDREERPDIDRVYMAVCQALTGSGGWPLGLFLTPDRKPFFAGTYFPKTARGGMIGLRELLTAVHEGWERDRAALLRQAQALTDGLQQPAAAPEAPAASLLHMAVGLYRRLYDPENGGFGQAPKFPTPHNLLFLLTVYARRRDAACLRMAEHTLQQMYRGGLFDHIGFGFCRYSTDDRFLIPHFEKMLYDNALLILAYSQAYAVTGRPLYLAVAEKTAIYILREMTAPEGGFYSAQDADSDGEEGKYYWLTPEEVTAVLGKTDGEAFNRHFGIGRGGSPDGKSLPNLLHSDPAETGFEPLLPPLYRYRQSRCSLRRDDKILTAWNALMIAAMCVLYLVSGKERYRQAAETADAFIRTHLCEGDTLFVSFREGKRGAAGFLDDYAACIFAALALYRATLDREYLARAVRLCRKVAAEFGDPAGGFYFCGDSSEALIVRPKETDDGAVPSGNALMAYNLVRLRQLDDDPFLRQAAEQQLRFLAAEASSYPPGHAMGLLALLEDAEPPARVTVVSDGRTAPDRLTGALPLDAAVDFLPQPTERFPLKNGKPTYYVCCGHRCLPPTNDAAALFPTPAASEKRHPGSAPLGRDF